MCQLLIQQFLVFLLSLKLQQNPMKIVFLYPFSNMAISTQNKKNIKNYTGKLYGLTGMLTSADF